MRLSQETVVDPKTGLERRKFGGPQPGSGRPKKKRASELVAEKVASHADELWEELWALRHDKSSAVRIKALISMLDVEERERHIVAEEQKNLEKMRHDDLVEYVVKQLSELKEKGTIPDTFDLADEDVQEIIGELPSGQ